MVQRTFGTGNGTGNSTGKCFLPAFFFWPDPESIRPALLTLSPTIGPSYGAIQALFGVHQKRLPQPNPLSKARSNSLLLIYSETSFRTFLLFWFCEIIKFGSKEEWKAPTWRASAGKKRKLFGHAVPCGGFLRQTFFLLVLLSSRTAELEEIKSEKIGVWLN